MMFLIGAVDSGSGAAPALCPVESPCTCFSLTVWIVPIPIVMREHAGVGHRRFFVRGCGGQHVDDCVHYIRLRCFLKNRLHVYS